MRDLLATTVIMLFPCFDEELRLPEALAIAVFSWLLGNMYAVLAPPPRFTPGTLWRFWSVTPSAETLKCNLGDVLLNIRE